MGPLPTLAEEAIEKVTAVEPDDAVVQIFVEVEVMLTAGTKVGFTVIVLVAVTVPHEPPLVVKVKVIVPDSEAPAVYVAVAGLFAFVQVPAPPLHVPPVAPPPTEPPICADVPPWHIAVNAAPAIAVGF